MGRTIAAKQGDFIEVGSMNAVYFITPDGPELFKMNGRCMVESCWVTPVQVSVTEMEYWINVRLISGCVLTQKLDKAPSEEQEANLIMLMKEKGVNPRKGWMMVKV